MATVTKTVGTTGRNYSTWTAWEAAADANCASGDTYVGEGYADSAFDENCELSATDPANWILRPAAGEGHEGYDPNDATAAVTFDGGQDAGVPRFLGMEDIGATSSIVEDIIFKGIHHTSAAVWAVVFRYGTTCIARRCIIHDIETTATANAVGIWSRANSANYKVLNCVVYDVAGASTSRAYGIVCSGTSTVVSNTTVSDIRNSGGLAYGIDDGNCYNVYADADDVCFGSSIGNYNVGSDASAPGANSLDNKAPADQFVSVGSDYHLKVGADCIGAGTDLGTGDEVELDIDGYDRDAAAVTWDVGADQYVAVATGGRSSVLGGGIVLAG